MRFLEAKTHITRAHMLYLPHPNYQLVIETDAAQNSLGIGHNIYTSP